MKITNLTYHLNFGRMLKNDSSMHPAIITLFFGAFCVGTSEFVIAGLLPEISNDLDITIPRAGLLVSVYAIGVAIGGPIVTLAIAKYPHRISLSILMLFFVIGQIVCVLASSFEGVITGRIIVALCHGSFYGIANVVLMNLVSEDKRGSAVAMLFAGVTLANILGVPLGTAIGNYYDWRTTFLVLVVLGAAVTISIWISLPDEKNSKGTSSSFRDQVKAIANQKTIYAFYIFAITRLGFWCLFTFISPFLINVTGMSESKIPLALLIFGVGALFGTLTGGRIVDKYPDNGLKVMLPMQVLGFVVLMVFGASELYVLIGMFVFGFVFFMPSSGIVNRILAGASAAPELAGTLISSVANIGIAVGAVLGARFLANGADYSILPFLGVFFATTAIVAMYRSYYLER